MIFWFFIACRSDVVYDGTLVGNAGSGKGKLAPVSNIQCVDPSIQVPEMRYYFPSGAVQTEMINADLFQEIPVPSGSPATVEIDLPAFELNCTQDNQDLTIPFQESTMSLTMNSPLESDFYIIELGDPEWLVAADPVTRLESGSAIFIDVDGDGVLSASEEQQTLGEGEQRIPADDDDEEDDDTGEDE